MRGGTIRRARRRVSTSSGIVDRNKDGVREDAAGRPARFSILVGAGITPTEKGAQFIRDSLAKIGVTVDVVALDINAVMGRWAGESLRRDLPPHCVDGHRPGDEPRLVAVEPRLTLCGIRTRRRLPRSGRRGSTT